MGFLTPFFLAGLGALAVPVLIHLINRERRVVVEFPSLMFLHKIPYRSIRRQKLRHLLLLLLRCLALALIVAAFARPVFHHDAKPVVSAAGAREVVLLIDRSYSMGYGSRWTRALDSARKVVGTLGLRWTARRSCSSPTIPRRRPNQRVTRHSSRMFSRRPSSARKARATRRH